MAAENSIVDASAQSSIISGLSGEFAGAAAARVRRMDQIAADTASMWAVAMTTPTVLAGMGFRMASESGSSRTRSETNNPSNTAAP